MSVTNYHVYAGTVIGETTASIRTDYLSDAEKNVTGTLDSTTSLLNSYEFKPYGSLLSKTGASDDPKFLWQGTRRFYTTSRNFADVGLKSMSYSTVVGTWLSQSASAPSVNGGTFLHGQVAQPPTCGFSPGYAWSQMTLTEVDVSDGLLQPANSLCGAPVYFVTHWKLVNPIVTGAVIQRIHMTWDFTDCKDPTTGGGTGEIQYIEAWNIVNGTISDNAADWFFFSRGNSSSSLCPKGEATTIGRVGVIEGCNAQVPPWGQVPEAGGLPSITPVPQDFAPGPSRKKIFYQYNCCVTNGGYKATGIFRPQVQLDLTVGPGWSGDLKQECKTTC